MLLNSVARSLTENEHNSRLKTAQNRGSPIPAASSETAQKTATRDRQKLPAQWVWKTAQLGGKTAELATLLLNEMKYLYSFSACYCVCLYVCVG